MNGMPICRFTVEVDKKLCRAVRDHALEAPAPERIGGIAERHAVPVKQKPEGFGEMLHGEKLSLISGERRTVSADHLLEAEVIGHPQKTGMNRGERGFGQREALILDAGRTDDADGARRARAQCKEREKQEGKAEAVIRMKVRNENGIDEGKVGVRAVKSLHDVRRRFAQTASAEKKGVVVEPFIEGSAVSENRDRHGFT